MRKREKQAYSFGSWGGTSHWRARPCKRTQSHAAKVFGPIWLTFAILATCTLGASPSHGQTREARYQELKQIADSISGEPDPLMRIANFEAAMKTRDPVKVEIAIRSALAIDDQQLHSVAAKAYLTSVRDVTFDWELPPQIAEKASSGTKLSVAENYVKESHASHAGILNVRLGAIDPAGAFKVEQFGAVAKESTGRSLGQRFVFRAELRMRSRFVPCNFDFGPTSELRFQGLLSCENFWAEPMKISAKMF